MKYTKADIIITAESVYLDGAMVVVGHDKDGKLLAQHERHQFKVRQNVVEFGNDRTRDDVVNGNPVALVRSLNLPHGVKTP